MPSKPSSRRRAATAAFAPQLTPEERVYFESQKPWWILWASLGLLAFMVFLLGGQWLLSNRKQLQETQARVASTADSIRDNASRYMIQEIVVAANVWSQNLTTARASKALESKETVKAMRLAAQALVERSSALASDINLTEPMDAVRLVRTGQAVVVESPWPIDTLSLVQARARVLSMVEARISQDSKPEATFVQTAEGRNLAIAAQDIAPSAMRKALSRIALDLDTRLSGASAAVDSTPGTVRTPPGVGIKARNTVAARIGNDLSRAGLPVRSQATGSNADQLTISGKVPYGIILQAVPPNSATARHLIDVGFRSLAAQGSDGSKAISLETGAVVPILGSASNPPDFRP